jgi:hypothetical protein
MKRKIQYATPLSIVVLLAVAFLAFRNAEGEAGATPVRQSQGTAAGQMNTELAAGAIKERHFARMVDGRTWALTRFVNKLGQVCAGARRTNANGEWGQSLSCREPATLFARGPLTYFVGSERESETSPTWDSAWVWGWAAPNVRRVDLVLNDCSRVALPVNSERLFFHVIGSASLGAGIAPIRLEAFGASGETVGKERAPLLDPITGRTVGNDSRCS